jgi:hypothetical protein
MKLTSGAGELGWSRLEVDRAADAVPPTLTGVIPAKTVALRTWLGLM